MLLFLAGGAHAEYIAPNHNIVMYMHVYMQLREDDVVTFEQ